MVKARYLVASMRNYLIHKRWNCPNCGHEGSSFVARKYAVTELRRCLSCLMLFRAPTDDPDDNVKFYDEVYTEGFTTNLPMDQELEDLKRRQFSGVDKDYSYYINVLKRLGLREGATVFDYGCSWGYGSYQLAAAGYDVTAFEVAPTRRNYASDKLGIRVVEDLGRFAAGPGREAFDCFLSAHVLGARSVAEKIGCLCVAAAQGRGAVRGIHAERKRCF
jgi:transcription elongation factor Elf1